MFTGIVEETGTVTQPGSRMKVRCSKVLEDAATGSSIAVSGVCLTVVQLDSDGFWSDLSPETLARTNLGNLETGSLVNLERPLAAGDRLSGHIVQGHVDATGELLNLEQIEGGNWWLRIQFPPELKPYIVFKGSIAVDGISLTVAGIEDGVLSAAIIPHTYQETALRAARRGMWVNLEVDLIAKYVENLLRFRNA